ncbi:hypothetical protein GPALN_010938 [Globodera pallida]|nr:hypothetical protein GPALN_010938 [Globodera pallida]
MVVLAVSRAEEANLSCFDSLVDRLLRCRASPVEFLAEIANGNVDLTNLLFLAGRLPLLGRECPVDYGNRRMSSFRRSLDFLHALTFRANAPWAVPAQDYVDVLTNFDCLTRLDEVEAVAEHLEKYVHEIRGPYAGPGSAPPDCLRHCALAFRVLDWHVGALCALTKHLSNSSAVPSLLFRLIGAVRRLRSVPFSALLFFLFFSRISGKTQADPMPLLLDRLNEAVARLKREVAESESMGPDGHNDQLTVCVRELSELVTTFPDFATPPANGWVPFRENFIHRRHRPAILTLASVYAIYRVLKSADEVADAFLAVSGVLGMGHEQMVEDLLRAGFLIQLETVSSTNDGDRREREALADVFVFFKLPQILSKMLSRGVPRGSVSAALGRLCASASLLDELDGKKSDNLFRFFMDALRRLDIVSQSDHEALVSRRDGDRAQNEELLQHLRSAIGGLSSSATTAEAAQMVKARSELINRVQKAKNAIDRVVPEKTEEMLRKLIPHEVPIDMLCSIYCASGELSQFSGWLAALNAQTQGVGTDEGVDAVASSPQGRLLIFDSTFLLMARIQAVFPDLRLEELVGARVHCAFFLWNKRYANCVERGEPMTMPASGGILRDGTVVDENFCAQFRANQFSAMCAHKTPFWSAEHSDFGAVLELVPLVGELLLDELHLGSPQAEEVGETVNNVFCTFRHLSSLWLCLVQWLDTQPTNAENLAKQTLARAMREFEIGWQKQQQQPTAPEKDNGHERLGYSMFLARRTLKWLAEARVKKEHPYTWLIGFAQRPLPALPGRKLTLLRADKEELKEEKQRLKEVFLCANQQGWASPDAVAHVNRCNVSLRMDIWLHCWLGQMLNQTRIATVDEGELSGELCLATAFTYPVPCLCEMIKQLVECVLFIPSAATSCSTRSSSTVPSTTITDVIPPLQQPGGVSMSESYAQQQKRHPIVGDLSPKATVMAKMLVRALQLLLWAGERSVLGKQEREKRLLQIYGIQQTTADGTCSRKRRHQSAQSSTSAGTCSSTNTLKQPFPPLGAIAGGIEPTSSEGSGGEEQKAAVGAAGGGQTTADNAKPELQQQQLPGLSSTPLPPPRPSSQPHKSSSILYSKQQQAALDTVRNVFERFNRVVRDCTLRPPVTFIIFFLHELAQAPQTEYWRQLVDMMPVVLVFVLGRLDPSALPLGLFMRIYSPAEERHWVKCMQYAMLVSRK